MELLQLYYFQVTARCEHISLAARKLHIAQPALSQTIRRLEKEVGTPLFDRVGKHIRLNDCGRIFLKYTDIALGALEDARTEIRENLSIPGQTVTLCVLAASSLMSGFLGEFTRLYPQIRFQIIQSAAALENTSGIDLTIHAAPWDKTDQASCVLLKEPMVIAMPAGHPLARFSSLSLASLSEQPFASLQKNSNLFQITKYYCGQAGFEPEIVLSCDNPQAFRQLLSLNLGIAMIPAITWPDMSADGIVTRPIKDIECTRYLILSWDKHRYLNTAAQNLRSFLQDYFREKRWLKPSREDPPPT